MKKKSKQTKEVIVVAGCIELGKILFVEDGEENEWGHDDRPAEHSASPR